MKRIMLFLFFSLLLLVVFLSWQLFGPTVHAPKKKYLCIKTGSTYHDVTEQLLQQKILSTTFYFQLVANRLHYSKKVKPGRYLIEDGMSVIDVVRMLHSGKQSPVKLVINKYRTKEEMAIKLAALFECTSPDILYFLNNKDSVNIPNIDSNTVMSIIVPDTYLIYWNGGFRHIFNKLINKYRQFWKPERVKLATAKGFTPVQISILASIVEEESNVAADRQLIASVYINRLKKNMKLQADPTVKFGLKDFSIKRILFGHLKYNSPYNTYLYNGLPPGPICTPSPQSIDAVLNAPATPYLYFAAKPDFSGTHNFAEDYTQHLKNAKAYQDALDRLILSRKNN